MKHENPIIVDIVDTHDIFQNQWRHRKTFYKKCNYRIQQIDSRKYTNMIDSAWSMVFEPTVSNVSETTSELSDEIGESVAQPSTRTCLISCIDLEE